MNFNVGDVLQARYVTVFVAVSYVISVLGSYVALYHAQHMFRRNGSINPSMAIGAAVSLGGVGIWAMHFIGMIGYKLPMRVVYDGWLTILSLAAAIVIAGIALILAGGRGKFSWAGWLMGSLLAGSGVCVMHYMGMYAMNLRADMNLDPRMVIISVLIAVSAAGAALWLAFHVVEHTHRIAAALTMGVAVCAMHYTGMSAAEFVCVASKAAPAMAIGGEHLPVLMVAATGLVLVFLFGNVFGQLGSLNRERTGGAAAAPRMKRTGDRAGA